MKTLLFSATKKDFLVDCFTAGGPGGQSQNRSNTAVRITHLPTGVFVVCREHKSQRQNCLTAFRRLAKLLVANFLTTEARKVSTEVVRTYHAVENRVKDKQSGHQQLYSAVLDDATEMIEARRDAMLALYGNCGLVKDR